MRLEIFGLFLEVDDKDISLSNEYFSVVANKIWLANKFKIPEDRLLSAVMYITNHELIASKAFYLIFKSGQVAKILNYLAKLLK